MTGGLRAVLLTVHVAAGSAALLVALALLVRRGGWASPGGGGAYLAAVLSACGTAVALSGPGSSLPASARVVLVGVAVLTAAAATAGVRGARRGSSGHLRLLHGSIVSLVTAVTVVSAPVVVWVAVAALGTALVEVAAHRRSAAGTQNTSDVTAGSAGTTSVT